MATIYDVAREAGVSSATVSHVINESRYVAADTRARVLSAIASLQYRRDGVARSLRRQKTGTIGLMIADITNPFFSEVVRSVEDAVHARGGGHNLILCNSDEDVGKERRYIDVLLERRVDGLILAPAGGNRQYLADLSASGFSLVFVDRALEGVGADAVLVDNRPAAAALTRHLIALGHRRIAVVKAGLAASSIEERVAGWRDALAEAAIPFDSDSVVLSASSVDGAYEAGMELLRRPHRPTAVFCTNNFLTLGMVRAVGAMGLSCPCDIAVAGFDDVPWASGFRPRLTVVAQPTAEIGRLAAGLLFDRLDRRRTGAPVRHLLPAQLIVRESCGNLLVRPAARMGEHVA
jgi:LacI family transcriptional regulator